MSELFYNLSSLNDFKMKCDLTNSHYLDVLKEIGLKYKNYYILITNDGVFHFFDIHGNTIDSSILKTVVRTIGQYIDEIKIKKCIIPNSVKQIGNCTFEWCESLESIVIPDSVKEIGSWAFCSCTSLNSVIISDSVKKIGSWAFAYCESLESIVIPDSVKEIGYNVFEHCKSLETITFKGKTKEEVENMKKYLFGIKKTCKIIFK